MYVITIALSFTITDFSLPDVVSMTAMSVPTAWNKRFMQNQLKLENVSEIRSFIQKVTR